MANLTRRFTFKRWVPDIGNNRELATKDQLALELAAGLTMEQMDALDEALSAVPELDLSAEEAAFNAAETPEEKRRINGESEKKMLAALAGVRTKAFEPYVRIVGGPHTIEGAPLETLAHYIDFAQTARDGGTLMVAELLTALRAFNSLQGPQELFSLRRSGGLASTGSPSVVKDTPQMAGR